ncbi:MAG TPA: beta-ketoacyl synthase chain length factor [Burkholderiales bacterium]|nr:beta-ketoacyl synthase chain length factor [Burkholderiales bacterium]
MLAPGLAGWPAAARVLSGEALFSPSAVSRPMVNLLPPAEHRRCAPSVAWALAVAQEAVANSGLPSEDFSVVFVSSDGDGDIVHRLCTALAAPVAEVSPTDFHNSVHNAATGYWSIGAHSSAPSTALCAYDSSLAAGLLEAACQITTEARRVLLVAVDLPYPAPLAVHRPVRHGFAAALALEAGPQLEISLGDGKPSSLPAGLESFGGNAAAACLPLLAALARPGGAVVRLPLAARVLQVRKSA